MLADIKFALRQLAKSPGFTVVAVITLALGIGACTAIFTVVNSVLLRPIDYPESERIVVIHETSLPDFPQFSIAPANFRDWAQHSDAFESLYLTRNASLNLVGEGEPVRVVTLRASGHYFSALGTQALRGRTLGPDDDKPGAPLVAVLSHAFWQRQFGGSPDAIGGSLRLNGQTYTVIGVMPANFQKGARTEVYVPLALTEEEWKNRGGHYLQAGGRLKAGVPVEAAQAQLTVIAERLATEYPDTNKNWSVRVIPLLEYQTGRLRPMFHTLLGAVVVLLLIACANVANLLLARAATRQREITVRAALGASRWHVVRQLLTESLALALVGGIAGLLVGHWGLDALLSIAPADLPRSAEIELDRTVVAVTLLVTLITGLFFGLVPAWQGSRVTLVDTLKEGTRGGSDSHRRHFLRSTLVVTEIALALILLTGAGLLIRSFQRLSTIHPGFDPHGAVMVSTVLPPQIYDTEAKQLAFTEAVIERFKQVPGVTHAAVTHVMPFSGNNYTLGLEFEGRDIAQGDLPSTACYAVSPDYFRAMGIPLLRGRGFTAQDRADSTRVAIISQSLAQRFFPNEDPLGKRINMTNGPQRWREIVGIVGDVKGNELDGQVDPQSYEAIAQQPFENISFVVRAPSAGSGLAASLRRELATVDPTQPVARLEPLDRLVANSVASERFAMTLVTVFSLVALILAAIGIYGIMAYAVAQRSIEFGIRLALGAQPGDVLRLVIKQGGLLVGIGVTAGLVGALLTSRLIGSLLYQTSTHDPLIFVAIALLMSAVALLACWLPARRATKVDPMIALRAE